MHMEQTDATVPMYPLIAIDYDKTYSLNPAMFGRLIEVLRSYRWRILIVTARYDNDEECLPSMPVPVIYTGRRAKKEFMEGELKTKVHVWMDDDPEHIIKPW